MINDTLSVLKKKAASRPIGFNLLPEQFTLPQLQTLYEAIYQTLLDKRNFRKKLNAMDILEKLDIKDNIDEVLKCIQQTLPFVIVKEGKSIYLNK